MQHDKHNCIQFDEMFITGKAEFVICRHV